MFLGVLVVLVRGDLVIITGSRLMLKVGLAPCIQIIYVEQCLPLCRDQFELVDGTK